MKNERLISGFSKYNKTKKIEYIASQFESPEDIKKLLSCFWHKDDKIQKLFDEFSENTVSNYFFPFGIAPNFLINNRIYLVPMVIEESSVVAAAANSAKFWALRGGFHAKVHSVTKIGQVHFIWKGDVQKVYRAMNDLKNRLIVRSAHLTANMTRRGGGIIDIEIVDMTHEMENYYQLKAYFNTVDSMGANFINSCLEDFAQSLKNFFNEYESFEEDERDCQVIMSILSNYTPQCLVSAWVDCPIQELGTFEDGMSAETFAWRFEKAVKIAQIDVHRATTHNKGIFNGIDAVALATGNDFRAIEACGHTYASRSGKYTSLTNVSIEEGQFHYELTIPLAVGTVGGLTSLHPLAKFSLELLHKPSASELMMITACAGLANNFGAVTTLVTRGIQKGHMKMHLLNILNFFKASDKEKEIAIEYFKDVKVTFNSVRDFLQQLREVKNNISG